MLLTNCKLLDAELDRQFEMPAPELSEPARQHLDECRRCRDLHSWISTIPVRTNLSPEVTRRIQSGLLDGLRPVRPLPGTPVSALQILVVFALLALGLIGVMGAAALERMSFMQALGITAILTAGASLFSISLAWQMVPGGRSFIHFRLMEVVVVLGFLAGVAVLFPWRTTEEFVAEGRLCSTSGILVAVPGSILFWLLIRRGAPLSAPRMGATLGAVAGLLGVEGSRVAKRGRLTTRSLATRLA
jgi:hypothetical protein